MGQCGQIHYWWPKLNVFSRWDKHVQHTTLLIFDLPQDMKKTLASAFLRNIGPAELQDPFWIYPRLVGEVVDLHDRAVWEIRDLVRNVEKRRVSLHLPQPDYPKLHEIARHTLHVTETLAVTSKTVESIQKHYKQFSQRTKAEDLQSWNHSNRLSFYSSLLVCLFHRSDSNQKRLQNEIALAFNTVAQHDSGISVKIAHETRSDSASMKTIAFVTLVFLPATFVSAVFSMSFFYYDSHSGMWTMSPKFWLYWAVSIPLTGVSVSLWYFWGCFPTPMPAMQDRSPDSDSTYH